jgi:hypothetical protein
LHDVGLFGRLTLLRKVSVHQAQQPGAAAPQRRWAPLHARAGHSTVTLLASICTMSACVAT